MGPRVKGVAFRSSDLCFAELCGADMRDRARTLMPPELADAYRRQQFLAASWYPIEWYCETFAAFRRAKGAGPELARDIGRLTARHDMASVYKQIFVKLVSPQALLGMSQRVFRSYYDTGQLMLVDSRKGYVRAECSGCAGWDESLWSELAGSSEALLELAGASHVRLRIVSGGRDGDDHCGLEAHWV